MLVVLKVSGHLYRFADKARELLEVVASVIDSGVGVAIVPGGSVFADAVRDLQQSSGVDDEVAHWMAIKAMEVYGVFIKSFSPRTVEAYDLGEVFKAVRDKLIPIVMPYKILKKHDEVPHSWIATSDSISIYVAHLLRANIVALGKVIEGSVARLRELRGVVKVDEVHPYVKALFDDYAPVLVKRLRIPLALFDIREPEVLHEIVKARPGNYTLILP